MKSKILFLKSKVATLISKSALKKSKLMFKPKIKSGKKNNQSSHFFPHLILLEHRNFIYFVFIFQIEQIACVLLKKNTKN